jgi:hypothetical protein
LSKSNLFCNDEGRRRRSKQTVVAAKQILIKYLGFFWESSTWFPPSQIVWTEFISRLFSRSDHEAGASSISDCCFCKRKSILIRVNIHLFSIMELSLISPFSKSAALHFRIFRYTLNWQFRWINPFSSKSFYALLLGFQWIEVVSALSSAGLGLHIKEAFVNSLQRMWWACHNIYCCRMSFWN